MSVRDLIELCLKNLFRRKTRTILSIVGVTVGTSAIVVMMSIGYGLSENYQKQIEEFGNLHLIKVHSTVSVDQGTIMKGQKGVINDEAIKTFSEIEGVDAVTPISRGYVNIIADERAGQQLEVYGVVPEVFKKFNFNVSEGSLFSKTGKNEIIFGSNMPDWFEDLKSKEWKEVSVDVMKEKDLFITGDMEYGRKNTNRFGGSDEGQKINYKEHKIKAVGVLSGEDEETGYSCYMKIGDLDKILEDIKKTEKIKVKKTLKRNYQSAWVYVGDINKSAEVSQTLKDNGFQAYSPSDWLEETKKTSNMIQGILGGIGGISLLVAAFGIANTMIMAIYERTKEIGVMKVIGANLEDIKKMFIVEAGLIGFMGGLAGVLISYIVSFLMNTVLKDILGSVMEGMTGGMGDNQISIIPYYLALLSIIAASLIGLLAGYMPARRAMNLSALESLRNE